MTCWDCEHNPCICRDMFPFARERTADGKIYDHLGGLLYDPHTDAPIAVIAHDEDFCPWCEGDGEWSEDHDGFITHGHCQACHGTGRRKQR